VGTKSEDDQIADLGRNALGHGFRIVKLGDRFFKQIKDSRAKKKYSQRKLAALIGISHGYLARIEGGHAVPLANDMVLKMAEVLDIPEEDLIEAAERERIIRLNLENSLPNSYSLVQGILSVMNEETQRITFDFFERRILQFREDKTLLAVNFANYLVGNLTLDEKPDNGLRPLKHYFIPWCSEIEEW
jgi:transcriptional regulator with XRE-family HTH domain